jgi:Mrp family chromosome partitioning ATPase
VILVVRAGRTTVKSIEDTMGLLEMHHAPILGVVLIGTLATREMYAYYQSYYRQAVENDAPPPSPPAGPGSESVEADGPDAAPTDPERADSPSYARNSDAQLPDPPQYLPPPPMPPPYGQPGSA